MYSVLNHDYNLPSPKSPKDDLGPSMGTPCHSKSSSSQYITSPNQKISMKNLYKNQLDALMQEKQKQKKLQKQILQRQKEEYREKMRQAEQTQKLKDLAYKNYYKVLMDSQDQKVDTYISPYEMREKLKESHIQHSILEQTQKSQHYEYEKKMRELERKNHYKEQLTRQIEERKKIQQMKRTQQKQQNIQIRRYTKAPQEIEAYKKEKKKEEMEMYRNDLDQFMQDKLTRSRAKNQSNIEPKSKIPENYHNPLINPLPYNIQNPYILKQMQKLSSHSIKKEFYDQEPNHQRDGFRQQSYFARHGNTLLK